MKTIKEKMIANAMAYNTALTFKYLKDKSDNFILANTHPEGRDKFRRELNGI